MEGLEKDTRKIKYFLMKTLETVHATTCRTFSIILIRDKSASECLVWSDGKFMK
jgi:hypothetical protein